MSKPRLRIAPRPSATLATDDLVIDCHDTPELIPPGEYEAVAGRAYTATQFGVLKLIVPFEVLVEDNAVPDGHRMAVLSRYYNARKKTDRLSVSWSGDFARDYAVVAGHRLARRDRLHLSAFVGAFVRVEVATVETRWMAGIKKHLPLPSYARYSKVARILSVIAGGARP
jgi:hypothetical protein